MFKKQKFWIISDWFTEAHKQDLVTRGFTNA